MKKYKWYIIGALAVLLGFTFIYVGYNTEKENYENEIQRLYHSKIVELEQQLRESERQRTVLVHRFDSLDILDKTTIRISNEQYDSLKRIPGSFKSLTSKQLEQRMIEEYAKAKQN